MPDPHVQVDATCENEPPHSGSLSFADNDSVRDWGIGEAYDNAVIESFWARMQTELLDRRRWTTRVELANAIFEYLEIFHNRQRRHSALGWRTPVEFEKLHATDVA
jgi:hypothetical protein